MRVLAALVLALIVSTAATAQQRIALVIGNAEYDQPGWSLANPENDAALVASALRKVDFDVTVVENASFAEMKDAIGGFGRRLRLAGEDTVGLFYFAGHGVQADGLNFLIPTDAEIRVDVDVYTESPRLGDLTRQMEAAGNAVNFIILDACRDNPLPAAARSSSGRGLAPAGRTRGTLIAYSTAPGATATDAPSAANSPFSAALAELLPTPGLSAEQLFRRVATEVENQTDLAQQPWIESGLRGGDFCFAGCSADATDTKSKSSSAAGEEIAWGFVTNSQNRMLLERFLAEFPNGRFSDEAASQIALLDLERPVGPTADLNDSKPGVNENTPDPMVQEVQELLNFLGFNAGPSDGVIDAQTVSAAEAFADWQQLTWSGVAEPAFLQRLRTLKASLESIDSTSTQRPNLEDLSISEIISLSRKTNENASRASIGRISDNVDLESFGPTVRHEESAYFFKMMEGADFDFWGQELVAEIRNIDSNFYYGAFIKDSEQDRFGYLRSYLYYGPFEGKNDARDFCMENKSNIQSAYQKLEKRQSAPYCRNSNIKAFQGFDYRKHHNITD